MWFVLFAELRSLPIGILNMQHIFIVLLPEILPFLLEYFELLFELLDLLPF